MSADNDLQREMRDLSHIPHNAGFFLVTCPKCGGECVTAARKFKKCPFCPHNINVQKAKRTRL
jgi:hypothetical protein